MSVCCKRNSVEHFFLLFSFSRYRSESSEINWKGQTVAREQCYSCVVCDMIHANVKRNKCNIFVGLDQQSMWIWDASDAHTAWKSLGKHCVSCLSSIKNVNICTSHKRENHTNNTNHFRFLFRLFRALTALTYTIDSSRKKKI